MENKLKEDYNRDREIAIDWASQLSRFDDFKSVMKHFAERIYDQGYEDGIKFIRQQAQAIMDMQGSDNA